MINTQMTTNNTVLLIKFAIIMKRSKKLSLAFWDPSSKNIGLKILVACLKVDEKFSRRPLRRIARYICFEYNLCAVNCISTEEPLGRGHSNKTSP